MVTPPDASQALASVPAPWRRLADAAGRLALVPFLIPPRCFSPAIRQSGPLCNCWVWAAPLCVKACLLAPGSGGLGGDELGPLLASFPPLPQFPCLSFPLIDAT